MFTKTQKTNARFNCVCVCIQKFARVFFMCLVEVFFRDEGLCFLQSHVNNTYLSYFNASKPTYAFVHYHVQRRYLCLIEILLPKTCTSL